MRFHGGRFAFFFITIFFWFLLLINGCRDDNSAYPPPVISFITDTGYVSHDTTLLLDSEVKLGIYAVTNSNVALTHINYKVFTNDSLISSIDTGIFNNSIRFTRLIKKGISEKETWQFYVKDRDGRQSNTISITFFKDSTSAYGPIKFMPSVVMGAQNSGCASFYALESQLIYTLAEAYQNQNAIDLVYFYDFIDGDQNTIASPEIGRASCRERV